MNQKEIRSRKRLVIVLTIILSLVLFGSGLLSGLYVSKLVEEKQQQDFSFLVEYVNKLDAGLKSFQIQQSFLDSLSAKDSCKLKQIYFQQLSNDLGYYWKILPGRLEAYERDRELTPAYITLKQQYTTLSLRAWLIARSNQACDTNIIPVLYFYTSDCENCVQQGEALDAAKMALQLKNETLVAFTVDGNSTDDALQLIEKYYGVTQAPALVINEITRQGNVTSTEEIERLAR